jgi:hypothetical protein
LYVPDNQCVKESNSYVFQHCESLLDNKNILLTQIRIYVINNTGIVL